MKSATIQTEPHITSHNQTSSVNKPHTMLEQNTNTTFKTQTKQHTIKQASKTHIPLATNGQEQKQRKANKSIEKQRNSKKTTNSKEQQRNTKNKTAKTNPAGHKRAAAGRRAPVQPGYGRTARVRTYARTHTRNANTNTKPRFPGWYQPPNLRQWILGHC